jgi:hypothetical protein
MPTTAQDTPDSELTAQRRFTGPRTLLSTTSAGTGRFRRLYSSHPFAAELPDESNDSPDARYPHETQPSPVFATFSQPANAVIAHRHISGERLLHRHADIIALCPRPRSSDDTSSKQMLPLPSPIPQAVFLPVASSTYLRGTAFDSLWDRDADAYPTAVDSLLQDDRPHRKNYPEVILFPMNSNKDTPLSVHFLYNCRH